MGSSGVVRPGGASYPVSVFCPENRRRFGGHYFTRIGGKWVCDFCGEER